MADATSYQQNWAQISELTLSNFSGKTINLLPFFLGIDIQEDIFMPVVSGNITLLDNSNLYENFPIIGEEVITISYKDFYSKVITRKFSVYSIGQREKTTEKGSVYVLNFCSAELLYNREAKYSKSYKDKLTHDIFSDAINRLNPTKPINIQETQELQDFVCPQLYPLEVCSQMANRAISTEGHTGSYLFFEDKEQFNFISIEKLIKAAPIKYKIGSAKTHGAKDPKFIIKNYVFKNAANNINGQMTGAQGVETKTLDLLNRKIEDNSYDHFGEDYEKIDRINSNNPDLKSTSEQYKHKTNKGMSKLTIKNNDFKSSKNKTIAKRYNSLSTYTNGPKIHAELAFNSDLTVGMMVDISIPLRDVRHEADIPEYDKYIQGKYIITALRQFITHDKGETIVELSKDSYSQSHSENIEG